MDGGEQALMCVLMLRGPQTPGELKQRTERMHAFADLQDVHGTLERLIERGLVARLERRPGHKEERYAQLLQDREDEQDGEPRQQAPAPARQSDGAGDLRGARGAPRARGRGTAHRRRAAAPPRCRS